ncbi:MAG: S-layer homology domain-containing protein [Vallitaleaceae bacterium]|nr:S-layer homology domain-containing protein [Vallitaleaceae bacterium]
MKLKGGNKNMRKTNRFVALLMALVLVFSSAMSTAVFANEDVAGTEFEVTVGKLKAVGIMEGYPDGTFKPEGEITRAEFAKIAVVALGLGDAAEVSRGVTRFPDVPATHWATGYINLAVNRGILVGYPDGSFQPNGKLTNAEAATILVRLVGLGPVVDKQGTWPANYIGRAANEGILKGVNVASSTNALRGLTAKMLLNTIEVPLWGADGYNNDGSVTYGKLSPEQTLLTDMLGIEVDSGIVTGYDVDDRELSITGVSADELADDAVVDFYEAYQTEVEVWINEDNDEIVFAEILSDYFIDAVEVDLVDRDVKLIDADDTYDFAAPADFDSDVNGAGDVATTSYDLAKVVLDDEGEVMFIDAFTFSGFLVVDSVDETVVTDVEDNELDMDGYQLMKDGMLVDVEDMVKGDIVFYTTANDGFAEIFTDMVEGSITTIYANAIKVAGTIYDFDQALVNNLDAVYLDENGDLMSFDTDAADQMKDEGDVVLYLDREGELVFITGELGEVTSSTVAGVLTANVTANSSFGEYSIRVKMLNELGAEVTEVVYLRDLDYITLDDVKVEVGDVVGAEIDYFDIDLDEVPDPDTMVLTAFDEDGNPLASTFGDVAAATIDLQFTTNRAIELDYNEDGDVIGLGLFDTNGVEITTNIDVEDNDKYVLSAEPIAKRLLNGTLLFDYTDGLNDDDTIVTAWSDLTDVDTITANATSIVYFNSDNEAVYVVSKNVSGPVDDTTDVYAYVTDFRENAGEDTVVQVTAWVNGVETTYEADASNGDLGDEAVMANDIGKIYMLTIEDDSDEVTAIVDYTDVVTGVVTGVSTSAKTITVGGSTYSLVSGYDIVDITDGVTEGEVASLVNVSTGDTVTLRLELAGTLNVDMVILTQN